MTSQPGTIRLPERAAAASVTVESRDLGGCRVYEITPAGLDNAPAKGKQLR